MSRPIQSENVVGLAKLRLRSELACSLRTSNGKPYMLVQDDLHSQFYRLGVDEWKIVKLFDGERTLRQVMADAQEFVGSEKASPPEVSRLASWLVQNNLAECAEGSLTAVQPRGSTAPGHLWHEPLNRTAQLGKWNPLFLKISLPNPQPVLEYVYPFISWLFSRFFVSIWLLVCLTGGYSVLNQWDRFRSSLQDVFASENWMYLIVVWIVLKALHELGHAIACMRYGGNITRCGLMFIVFSPIAWVDVTSAWRFRSKWQRILVSAAGMYLEFFIAAVAAIIWARTDDPVLATLTRNVVISASATTLLFNLNFLMRFDGYYILSDLLDIQNLYGAGQQYLQYFNRRYILDMQASPPNVPQSKLGLVRAYGVGALLWRMIFCVGILVVAATMFHGAGIILAMFSGLVWFAVPCLRYLLLLLHGVGNQQPNRKRFVLLSAMTLLILVVCMLLPWPGNTSASGVVEFSPLQTVRVDSPGFVREICVIPGQQVQAGELLLKLENRELARELADIELQIEIQEIARRVEHRDNEMAEYVAIGQKLESLREQREQLAGKVGALRVLAPIPGTVIAQELESFTDKYVDSGAELLSIGSTGEKEVRISIRQEDVEAFRQSENGGVRIGIKGHYLSQDAAELERVNPRATRRVLHAALSASSGGPLAVQQNPNDESQESVLLVEPHFEGLVAVPSQLSNELRAGEVCRVSLGRGYRRVYEQLWTIVRAYFEKKSQRGMV